MEALALASLAPRHWKGGCRLHEMAAQEGRDELCKQVRTAPGPSQPRSREEFWGRQLAFDIGWRPREHHQPGLHSQWPPLPQAASPSPSPQTPMAPKNTKTPPQFHPQISLNHVQLRMPVAGILNLSLLSTREVASWTPPILVRQALTPPTDEVLLQANAFQEFHFCLSW